MVKLKLKLPGTVGWEVKEEKGMKLSKMKGVNIVCSKCKNRSGLRQTGLV